MKEQVLLDVAILENILNLDDQIVDYVVNILKDDTADEAMEGLEESNFSITHFLQLFLLFFKQVVLN
jgi:hypothetical protein